MGLQRPEGDWWRSLAAAGVHCAVLQVAGEESIGVVVALGDAGKDDRGYDRAVYRLATSDAARAFRRASSASLAAEADNEDISA